MKHLVLIGLMGSGKTTVGRRAARRLERTFIDTDDLIVKSAGMNVDDIFRDGGEPRFRELERTVVADVCAAPEPLVVATGGGAVLDPDNRRLLRAAGIVVWLRAPATVLARRVGDGSTRPLLAGDPVGALARLERLREPAYEAAAHEAIETEHLSLDEVVTAVLHAYEKVRT